MVGRPLQPERAAIANGYDSPAIAVRRRVLRETIARFTQCPDGDRYLGRALANLARWKQASRETASRSLVEVLPGDWGAVTLALTKRHGACFAVLNMANAYVPGGGYVEGAVAQEENMYRRTDCHFHIAPPHYDPARDCYTPQATRLLSGEDGVVYLDTSHPRVCIRGPEDRHDANLGYSWLDDDEIFPFSELKAAAQDLRDGSPFNADLARQQIRAQLHTLMKARIRHVVLGAFGCGAFENPARRVASIYREEITACRSHFDVIAFAIFNAGYGPDNYSPFRQVFDG